MAKISPPGKRMEHTAVALLRPRLPPAASKGAHTRLLHIVASCSPSRAPAYPHTYSPSCSHPQTPARTHPCDTLTRHIPLLHTHPGSCLAPTCPCLCILLPSCRSPHSKRVLPGPLRPHTHARTHRGAATRLLDGLACSSAPGLRNSGLVGTTLPRG